MIKSFSLITATIFSVAIASVFWYGHSIQPSTHVLFTALSMSMLTLVAFFHTLQFHGVGKRVLQLLCVVIAVGSVYSGTLALTMSLMIFNILGVGYLISAAPWMVTCFNLNK
jgi:hypothetical protein